jgi:hypothetical protein
MALVTAKVRSAFARQTPLVQRAPSQPSGLSGRLAEPERTVATSQVSDVGVTVKVSVPWTRRALKPLRPGTGSSVNIEETSARFARIRASGHEVLSSPLVASRPVACVESSVASNCTHSGACTSTVSRSF